MEPFTETQSERDTEKHTEAQRQAKRKKERDRERNTEREKDKSEWVYTCFQDLAHELEAYKVARHSEGIELRTPLKVNDPATF